MNFKAYDILYVNDNVTKTYRFSDVGTFFSKINQMPKVQEGSNYFAPLYMHQECGFIFGTLVQSYHTILTTFEDKGKEEKILDENKINDKTIFYINVNESVIYIQGKVYPSSTLSKALTIERITNIVGHCLEKAIVLIPANISYSVSEMDEIFTRSYVKKIIFQNIRGIELPIDSVLHNPRADLDKAVAESWNMYSKDTLDYLELRAKSDEKLNKNPIAKIGMRLAQVGNPEGKDVIKEINLVSDGEALTIKPKGNDTKIVSISKNVQDDSYQIYQKILKKEGY